MNKSTKRCRRAPNDQPLASRREAHRSRMSSRRLRQLTRTPGFTPMRNERINNAVDSAVALVLLANAAAVKAGLAKPLSTNAAYTEAWNTVRRQLPSRAMVRDWRQGLPSKNDNPTYRKGYVRDLGR